MEDENINQAQNSSGSSIFHLMEDKKWANDDNLSTGEEVECDVTGPAAATAATEPREMSSLTDFIRHQATD